MQLVTVKTVFDTSVRCFVVFIGTVCIQTLRNFVGSAECYVLIIHTFQTFIHCFPVNFLKAFSVYLQRVMFTKFGEVTKTLLTVRAPRKGTLNLAYGPALAAARVRLHTSV